MKLYTEEQVKRAMLHSYLSGVERPADYLPIEESIISELTPIELPSDEEIENQSKYIAHNYFDMHNSNHYQGLLEGCHRMAFWMKEQILNENK